MAWRHGLASEVAARTDVGPTRSYNEDALLALAITAPGPDNISALVARVEAGP